MKESGLTFFFFLIQASLWRNHCVRKILTTVTADMWPHYTLIEVNSKDPANFFILYESSLYYD